MIDLRFWKEWKKAWKDKVHPFGWKKRENEAGEGTGKFEGRSVKRGKKAWKWKGEFEWDMRAIFGGTLT